MRHVYYTLLATVLAFLVNSDTLAIAAEPSQTKISGVTALDALLDGRQLRGAETGSPDVEERGVDALVKWAKVKYWAQVGKSDEYVKQSLGLERLTGNALTASPAFKYYQEYLRKTGGPKLIKWLHHEENGRPTHEVWKRLGLEDMPAAEREGSQEFKTYVRYATMYDDQLHQRLDSGAEPMVIVGSMYPDEMIEKIGIWAKKKRSNSYVKRMLGLERKSEYKLSVNEEYQLFLKLVGRKIA
ncbi:hypothetical protein PRIC2_007737 [Phytophthora ramorum]